MAIETVTILKDDLDGSTAEGTVRFSLDGTDYEMELNAAHDARLRETLGPYIAAGRRRSGGKIVKSKSKPPAPSPAPSPRPSPNGAASRPTTGTPGNAEIREWAKSKGYDIRPRGRISADVVKEYMKNH